MRKNDAFSSERLHFRGISLEDTDCLVKWRSDPDVIRYYYDPTPITEQSHLRWYSQHYLGDEGRFDFIVTEKASGRKIGFVSIKDICRETRSGEISYSIAEKDFQKKGYAKEAILALMAYLQPDVTTIYAVVHHENTASIHTAEAAGFLLDDSSTPPFIRYKRENL